MGNAIMLKKPGGGGQPFETYTFDEAVTIENGYNGMQGFWSKYISDFSDVYAILSDMQFKNTIQYVGSVCDAKNISINSGYNPEHICYGTNQWGLVGMNSFSTYIIPAGTRFRIYRKWW